MLLAGLSFFTMTFYFMYAIDFVNLAEVEIYVDAS